MSEGTSVKEMEQTVEVAWAVAVAPPGVCVAATMVDVAGTLVEVTQGAAGRTVMVPVMLPAWIAQ